MYIDQELSVEVLIKLNTYTNWEGQLLKVKGGGLSQTFVIGNIYRPPRSLNENYNEFIHELIFKRYFIFKKYSQT